MASDISMKTATAERAPLTQRVIDHFVARIHASPVEREPFMNSYFTGVFPDDVYAEIRRRLPARERYLPLNLKRWKNAEGQSTRDKLCLSAGEIDRIAPEDRQFWSELTDALTSRELQQAIYFSMRDDVSLRLGCAPDEVVDREPFTNVLLVRDFADYRLKPHPDGKPRVVTMMIYLADEGSPTDLGTSLYRERPLLDRLLGKRFEEVARFPFLPNSVGTFVVNDRPDRRSWHGRELIEGQTVVRDSIIVSFMSEEGHDNGMKHNY
ncbi:MAG: hypothetical protein Q7V31_00050 [Parvibaculum sp.]|uniref:hypothetical protein n=1 Tax=Parvibaculum sp. TaxID=2024848 RepID=UPI00272132DD|nr:hypothetical protein [Parvibaculum sp.]MDO8837287.1 hypothetical protein [Parvibaculum sp.]